MNNWRCPECGIPLKIPDERDVLQGEINWLRIALKDSEAASTRLADIVDERNAEIQQLKDRCWGDHALTQGIKEELQDWLIHWDASYPPLSFKELKAIYEKFFGSIGGDDD